MAPFRVRSILPFVAVLSGVGFAVPVAAQQIFRSTQSANLATTETLRPGNWLFEISHRFVPPISDGADALWGFDGPALNRLGLSYIASDGLVFSVLRTNLDDNLELNGRWVFVDGAGEGVLVDVGVMAGAAWNTSPPNATGVDGKESQLYAQLIVDALLGERLAVGVVPTYLRNPRIRDVEADDAFSVGIHAQAYLTDALSLLGEWIVSEERVGLEHDSGTFGLEARTRGHVFKVVVTNQVRMNPTQFLAGTPSPFDFDELRLGFNITRLLPF